jgi:hypothetical protein
MIKTCLKCKMEKDTQEFGIDNSKSDKLMIYCKSCCKQIQNEYYQQNSESLKLRQKKFRLEHANDPGYKNRMKEHNKKYRELHKEEIKLKKLHNREKLLQRRKELRREHHETNPSKFLLESSKSRARKKGLEHTITIEDIIIPSMCPVLGIPLKIGIGLPTDNSPSLDRIDNTKGYIKENVIVISHRANTLKRNATIDELEKIVDFYKHLSTTPTLKG